MIKEKFKVIPFSPFGLVIALTLLSLVLGIIWGPHQEQSIFDRAIANLEYWQNGFFGLLEFTLQMMMILVLGYCLAVYQPFHALLRRISQLPKNQTQAVVLTAFITCLSGLINWGFGLIIGAVLARFMAISLKDRGLSNNPVLLASAGYLGMAIWHGGISGSAPLKVAENDHFLANSLGVIPVSDTIFSPFNILITSGLILIFVTVLILFCKTESLNKISINPHPLRPIKASKTFGLGSLVGFVIIFLSVISFFKSNTPWTVVNLNFVIFFFFGLAMIAFKSLSKFSEAVGSGIKSSVDIFIQFPFYAGIIGIMTSSGLIIMASEYILKTTGSELLPYFTLGSAAMVNLLIPSGGGQWAIQGPILAETAVSSNLPIGKMIMLFAYGDQISNLLQPFWALPLLSITGVSASQLFKYCFWLFIAGYSYLTLCIFLFF